MLILLARQQIFFLFLESHNEKEKQVGVLVSDLVLCFSSFTDFLLSSGQWSQESEGLSEAEQDLKDLKEQLVDDFPVGPLIKRCCTLDQVEFVCFKV